MKKIKLLGLLLILVLVFSACSKTEDEPVVDQNVEQDVSNDTEQVKDTEVVGDTTDEETVTEDTAEEVVEEDETKEPPQVDWSAAKSVWTTTDLNLREEPNTDCKIITTLAKGTELKTYTGRKTAVALGSFDSIHKGHISIITEMCKYAKEHGLLSVVQIFEIPPKLYNGEALNVNTMKRRLEILEEMGVEAVVIESFTQEFRGIEYEEFVSDFLSERYNAKAVFAGENYRFGHLAKGDAKALVSECEKWGIDAKIIPCVEIDGTVSSSRIREFIRSGEVERATEFMTRPHVIEGEIVRGKALGRTIGFPTANMNIPENQILPKSGVYLARVLIDGKTYFGITNVGSKPTVDDERKNVETYIQDFNQEIYGKIIKIEFLKRIRDIVKFDSLEELKKQLEEDKKAIRQN